MSAGKELGITRNYNGDLTLADALVQHRRFASASLTTITRIEIRDVSLMSAGFVGIEAFGPAKRSELAALDELFGVCRSESVA